MSVQSPGLMTCYSSVPPQNGPDDYRLLISEASSAWDCDSGQASTHVRVGIAHIPTDVVAHIRALGDSSVPMLF